MQVTVEATGRLERTMKVRVPADQIEKEVSRRLKRVAQTARIKGFRPGKIPPKVGQKRYGSQVRQEVLSDVLQRSYQQAIRQEELLPAGGPRIEPDEVREGQDFSYTAVFEIFPKVKFSRLEGLELEPHTRALLFDTFGPGTVRIPPELLRFDRVPKRDWDFWLLAYKYRAARARKRWGRRLSIVAWVGAGVAFIAILSSPSVSPTVKFLVAITVFLAILIFGFLVS
jgi:hypothetical protein